MDATCSRIGDPVRVVDQIERIVRVVDEALGPEALGIYLHGSAVHGGLRPASDLDVLVVAGRSLDGQQRQALVDGLLPISGPRRGGRSIELTVVAQPDVRPWSYPPTCDFLYGDWLRGDIEAHGPPKPEPGPDLAIVLTLVLAGNHPLRGPAPAELLDPVPPADVARASVAGIPGLLDDLPGGTRNVVLTFARIWTTLSTGEIRSKDAAADWALAHLPPEHRPVLEHARQLYLTRTYADETWPEDLLARVGPHVDAVLAEIRAVQPG
jgi:streptomycin 3"-adenylyltransferase